MISSSPRRGDIWLAYVAFADHPDVGKVRPVLILALGEADGRILAAKITTSTAWTGSSYLEIPNWEQLGLRRLSYVQISPVFEIEKSKLLRDAPLGSVPSAFLNLVVAQINASGDTAS